MKTIIRQAMAKAFFASALADAADEAEERGINTPIGAGVQIFDVMPAEIDSAAWHAAYTLISGMEKMHSLDIVSLFKTVQSKIDASKFGHYAAMQAMSHGVGLYNYDITMKVPYVEFGSHSLSKDYF